MSTKIDERLVKEIKKYLSEHFDGVALSVLYKEVEERLRKIGILPPKRLPEWTSRPSDWYQHEISSVLYVLSRRGEAEAVYKKMNGESEYFWKLK